MTELATARLADYDEGLFELEMASAEPEMQKLAVSVEIPTEFQAMIGGLSSDGKDKNGKHVKIWKIDGIQSIDFSQCEVGKTMVFTINPGYDLMEVHTHLTEWLSDLRARRQHTERTLARSAIRN